MSTTFGNTHQKRVYSIEYAAGILAMFCELSRLFGFEYYHIVGLHVLLHRLGSNRHC